MLKATRAQTKAHNKTLILNTIYHSQGTSRADVARITGLTRSTVSDLVAEWIDEGVVQELGYGQSVGGKPPVLLGIIDEARHILGIDLASGEFRGAVIDLRGEIQHSVSLPIDSYPGSGALDVVYELIDQLLKASTSPVIGIGIGAPGLMDSERGIVLNAVNLDWKDLPLATTLEDRYQFPVYIANDTQISTLAEYNFGGSDKTSNLLLVKISRGVGAGLLINQQLFQGDGFGAGEIGHIRVEENGKLCRCGNHGCLETIISSRAVRQQANDIAANHPESQLHQVAKDSQNVMIEEIMQAYDGGDELIIALVESIGHSLGKVLSFMVSTLNIHRVVLAGSVAVLGEGMLVAINRYLESSILPGLVHDTSISTTILGEEIVILGAAGLVMQNELGIQ